MAGWLIVWDPDQSQELLLRKFEGVFSGDGLPMLRTKIRAWDKSLSCLTWAWQTDPDRENTIKTDEEGSFLLRHGYVIQSRDPHAAPNAPASVQEWNGSFCLARADLRRGELTLWTDRFASRPVWYRAVKSSLIASNNPAAIASLIKEDLFLNGAGLWALFATSRHVGRRGLYDGIHNLGSGEFVRLTAARPAETRAWHERKYIAEQGRSARDWAAEIASALKSSADRHKRLPVEPHLFLSGGLDSRIAAASFGPPLRTVTLTAAPNMNSRLAEWTARRLKISHRTVARDNSWYLRGYEAAALIAAGNYDINHAHFIPALQEVEGSAAPAYLLGDLLENFNKHYCQIPEDLPGPVSADNIADVFHRIYSFAHKDPKTLSRLFRDRIGRDIRDAWREELSGRYHKLEECSPEIEDRLDDLFRWNNVGLCPTYLMHECVIPFAGLMNLMFDNELHDIVFRIPVRIKSRGAIHKWTLWHLDKPLAVLPNSNSWLPPVFPNSWYSLARKVRPVVGRIRRRIAPGSKAGPVIKTEGSWHRNQELFRKDESYRLYLETLFHDPKALPPDIFDQKAVRKTWEQFLAGNLSRFFEINMLLSFGTLNRRLPAQGLRVRG